MNPDDKPYEIDIRDGWMYLKLKGDMTEEILNESTTAVLDLAKQHNISCLLDDIR